MSISAIIWDWNNMLLGDVKYAYALYEPLPVKYQLALAEAPQGPWQ